MRTFQTFIILLLLITTAPGCAKFRQLTRRDYAQLHDPFAPKQGDSVARAGLSDSVGVTRIEDTKPAGTTVASSKTNNSVSTASGSSEPPTRSLRGINAQTGPSLTDFVSKSTRTPFATAKASGSSDNSADMAEFANFLEDEAVASGLDDTAMELDKEFADWATTQKQEWSRQTRTGNARQQKIRQVSQSGPSKAAAGIPTFPETSSSNAPLYDDEVATPLILQPGQRQKIAASAAPVAQPPVGSANPFAELSPEFQPAKRGQQTTTPPPVFDASPPQPALSESQWGAASARQSANGAAAAFGGQPNQQQKNTIDAGFNFDTGWKLVHPLPQISNCGIRDEESTRAMIDQRRSIQLACLTAFVWLLYAFVTHAITPAMLHSIKGGMSRSEVYAVAGHPHREDRYGTLWYWVWLRFPFTYTDSAYVDFDTDDRVEYVGF